MRLPGSWRYSPTIPETAIFSETSRSETDIATAMAAATATDTKTDTRTDARKDARTDTTKDTDAGTDMDMDTDMDTDTHIDEVRSVSDSVRLTISREGIEQYTSEMFFGI